MASSIHKLPSLKNVAWLVEPRLQRVMAVLDAAGEVRVAGGAVRNSLMGLPVVDVDLATTLVPQDVMRLCKEAGFGVHPTGLEHGTITVTCNGTAFEVTTLRQDVETDGRHAVVKFSTSYPQDAARRDFTINALYCNAEGEVFDPVGSYSDVLRRRVRFVGKPTARIREDYLRILRFFRFHALYGKETMDADGLAACARLRAGLKKISAERIRQEMLKLLAAPGAVATLKTMAKAKVLNVVLSHIDDWRVIDRLPQDGLLRLFVLAKDTAQLKDRFRLSNEQAKRIETLAAAPAISPKWRAAERRAALYALKPETWRDVVDLAFARSRAKRGDPAWVELRALADGWNIPKFPLNGGLLLARGFKAGPHMGEALRYAEDYWVASDFKTSKDELLDLIEGHKT